MGLLSLLALNVLLSRIPYSMTQQTIIDSCNLVTATLNNLTINVFRLSESVMSARTLADEIQQKMQQQGVQLQSVHQVNRRHINPQQGIQGILNGQLQGGQNNQVNPLEQLLGTVQHQPSGQSSMLSGNNGLHPQNGLINGQPGNTNMQHGDQGQSPAHPGNVGVQPHIDLQNGQLQKSPGIPNTPGSGGTLQNAQIQQSPGVPGVGGTMHNGQQQQIPGVPNIPGSGGTLQNAQHQQSPGVPGAGGTMHNGQQQQIPGVPNIPRLGGNLQQPLFSLRSLGNENSQGGLQPPPPAGGTIVVNPGGSQIVPHGGRLPNGMVQTLQPPPSAGGMVNPGGNPIVLQAGGLPNGMLQTQQGTGMINGRFIGPSGPAQYEGGHTTNPLTGYIPKNESLLHGMQFTEEMIRQHFMLSATTRICTSFGYLDGYSIVDPSCTDKTVLSPSYHCYYHYNCCGRYRCMKYDDDTQARCCFDFNFFQQGHFDYCTDDSHCNTEIGFKCHKVTYTCVHEYLLTLRYNPGLNPGRPGDDSEKNNKGTG